jgi:hypothetical protein
MRPGYPADPSASVGMTDGKDSKYRHCDNCFFSVWMMGSDRPMLGCKQRSGHIGRWRIVRLKQSCGNFYPSGTFKAGAAAERRIPLTRGKFAIVDAQDYYRLAQFNWCANGSDKTKFYAVRKRDGKHIKMHRLIMEAPGHLFVDHIDHNGLNNCRSNLRLCTQTQNNHNATGDKGKSSKYKGVFWHKCLKKWAAKIGLDKKRYKIGYFTDEIAAAKAYDKKAGELHGEFACLNFPPEK